MRRKPVTLLHPHLPQIVTYACIFLLCFPGSVFHNFISSPISFHNELRLPENGFILGFKPHHFHRSFIYRFLRANLYVRIVCNLRSFLRFTSQINYIRGFAIPKCAYIFYFISSPILRLVKQPVGIGLPWNIDIHYGTRKYIPIFIRVTNLRVQTM